MIKHFSYLGLGAGLLAFAFITTPAMASSTPSMPDSPAEILSKKISSLHPISMLGISIGNFGVVDGHIYRGEQPGGKDYASLAAIGVKTIIDLRGDAKGSAQRDAISAGLQYVHIGIDGYGTPTDAQARAFLQAVDDPDNGVVYVHCAGGRHRTGSMIAIYRMTHDGWTVDQAYKEMLAYDFYTSGGHDGFKTYVDGYYRRMTTDPSSVPIAYQSPASVANTGEGTLASNQK